MYFNIHVRMFALPYKTPRNLKSVTESPMLWFFFWDFPWAQTFLSVSYDDVFYLLCSVLNLGFVHTRIALWPL